MIWILFPEQEQAEIAANALYRLSQPLTVGADNVTRDLAGPPVERNGAWGVPLDPDYALPIHPEVVEQLSDPDDEKGARAEFTALATALAKTPEALSELLALILAGGTLPMAEMIGRVKPEMLAYEES